MAYYFFTALPVFIILSWLILFFLDKRKNAAKRFLTLFLSVALVNYITHYFYFNHNYEVYRILDSVWVFTSLAVYPLYYYYIRLLTKDLKADLKWSWILLPAIILALFSTFIYLLMSPEETEIFIHEILYQNRKSIGNYPLFVEMQLFRIHLFKLVFATEVFLTLYFGLRLIGEFNAKVRAFYSNIRTRELSIIRLLLFFFVITSFISMASNLIGKDYFVAYPYLLAIPSIAHSVALFGIGYAGYRQHFTIRDLTNDLSVSEMYPIADEAVEITGREFDLLFDKLEKLLEKEQVYRNPELRLSDVALQLGSNRTYVSRLIHRRCQTNFCDYVNEYRVRHAERMLTSKENAQVSLDVVAAQSGFASNSTFYRVFEKKNGMSPGKFRNVHLRLGSLKGSP